MLPLSRLKSVPEFTVVGILASELTTHWWLESKVMDGKGTNESSLPRQSSFLVGLGSSLLGVDQSVNHLLEEKQ